MKTEHLNVYNLSFLQGYVKILNMIVLIFTIDIEPEPDFLLLFLLLQLTQ